MMLGTNNIKGFINFLETYPRDILVYRLTLLLLVFYHPPAWIGEVPVRVSALFMFFSPKLSRNRWLWVLLFIAYSIFAARYWYYIDNHQYLITYWVGVCFISTLFKNRIQVLKINAHLLIVLTFYLLYSGNLLLQIFLLVILCSTIYLQISECNT
jgi:hypothetical protein